MNAITSRIVATTLLIFAVQSGWAEEMARRTAAAAHKDHIMVTPKEIKWGECPPFLPPGAKCAIIQGDPQVANVLFTIRSRMPDNYRLPSHFHSADEHLTVISGTFMMGLGEKFDDKAMKPMTVGSFMVMPKGAPHFAKTRGETVLQVHAIGPLDFIYVNPAEDPSRKH